MVGTWVPIARHAPAQSIVTRTALAALVANLDKKGSVFWAVTGCVLVAGVGVADVGTGSEIAFSLFYLLPIGLTAWFSGSNLSVAISVASAFAWAVSEAIAGPSYSAPGILYWNSAVRLAFFLVVSVLLPKVKELERERAAARLDDLTGLANRRSVFEVVQSELNRSQRYKRPFAIAYFDLDNFKAVNDQYGHDTGDRLLRALASRAKSHLRRTDVLGRLGGDEFLLLFPEINQDAVRVAAAKVQSVLLDEMQRHQWPVTLSCGVLTYVSGATTAAELITRADELMYSVKQKGKNAIAYAEYAG